ncbi:lipoprotein, putative [Bacillus subtilis subsp. subtilis str. RO-NN-1]|nr:lipoprotein, putative [Bacillus subtilis subsp. subtilis str. RO-NN-1]
MFIRLAQETFRKRSFHLVIIVAACGNIFKNGWARYILTIFSADSSI